MEGIIYIYWAGRLAETTGWLTVIGLVLAPVVIEILRGEQEMSDFQKLMCFTTKNRQIVIINNATHIGKRKVEREINEGSKFVGRIVDTPLSESQLRGGFSTYESGEKNYKIKFGSYRRFAIKGPKAKPRIRGPDVM